MPYHLRKIEKRKVGTIEKILEEVEEYQDAMEQGCSIMALVELSDIYGALQLVAEKHNVTMDDLKSMATVTRRAFEDGSRKSADIGTPHIELGMKQECAFNGTDEDIRNARIKSVVDELIMNPKDIRIDKHDINNDVMITHIPSGYYVDSCLQATRQHNKTIALFKLAEIILDSRDNEIIEKIRTRFNDAIIPHKSISKNYPK